MPTVIQWVKHLEEKIQRQTAYAAPYELRYQNKYVIPFLEAEYREVYGKTAVDSMYAVRPPRTGTAAVVVDAIAERLTVLGARSESKDAAEAVEVAWEENDLDVMHQEACRELLIKARSFAQVSFDSSGQKAIVGVEAAEQMAVHREAGPPYDVDAALKLWRDEWTGIEQGRLLLRSDDRASVRVIDLRRSRKPEPDPEGSAAWSRWVIAEETSLPLPWVPVVEFTGQARLLQEPVSFIEPIETGVDLTDLIEGLLVFAGHFGAVPIRYGTGLKPLMDPVTKKPIMVDGKPFFGFNPRADHVWVSTTPDAKFGQLTPAGLEQFTVWAEHAAAKVRAKTGLASTYFSLDLKSHMSAELLKTDEAPMVRKVNRMGRRGPIGQATRRLMEMILHIEAPGLRDARVLPRWESPATRIEAVDADVYSKLAPSLGAAKVADMVLGWSPQEIAEGVAEAEQARDRASRRDPLHQDYKSFMAGGLSADAEDDQRGAGDGG